MSSETQSTQRLMDLGPGKSLVWLSFGAAHEGTLQGGAAARRAQPGLLRTAAVHVR